MVLLSSLLYHNLLSANEDEDVQEAIRRSLRDPFDPGYDTGPRGYTPSPTGSTHTK